MEPAKRECILIEAARAFTRLGFRKASVDEIARKAGVAKGTVYLAVESKEELLYQVLHRELRAWLGDVAQEIDPRKPADQLLQALTIRSFQSLESRPLVQELLFGRMREVLPGWTDRLAELRALGASNVAEVLRLGVRQGKFRPGLDVDQVASLLMDLQLSTFAFSGGPCDPDAPDFQRRMAAALDLVLDGLRHRPRVAVAAAH